VLTFKFEHGVFSHVLITSSFTFTEGLEMTKHLNKRWAAFPRHISARGARSQKYHQSPFHNQNSSLSMDLVQHPCTRFRIAGRFVAYYRVSTQGQGRSGLGLEAQRKAVQDYLDGGHWKLIGEFTEIESGKRSDRPKLAEAMRAAKRHKATLVIAKLDRLARSVAFISDIMEGEVEFVAVDMPMANRLTVHILAAVAEHEREMISQRTKAALAAAKARGTLLGNRTNLEVAQRNSRAVRSKASVQFVQNAIPVIRQIQATGLTSLREVAGALNARGIRSARGGEWHPTQVKRVLERANRGIVT
jgi:DNA invertase Pin-like site-specific DNA recombinase